MLQNHSNLPSRERLPLHPFLDKTLSSYALAAGAAGVSLLALTQSAEAKIVYTPAHQRIGKHTFLDLNGDGINDFQLSNTYTTQCFGINCHQIAQTGGFFSYARFNIYGSNVSNQALGAGGYVSRLAAGVSVGSAGPFQGEKLLGGRDGLNGVVSTQFGPWLQGGGTHEGYVGLKFVINGEVHFGWARIKTVSANAAVRPFLLGYAYETNPNTPIITGKTSGATAALAQPDLRPSRPAPAILGLLARGADGLNIWRKEEEAVKN